MGGAPPSKASSLLVRDRRTVMDCQRIYYSSVYWTRRARTGPYRGGMAYLRLLVVYDADATLVGEITYIVGHALGLRECAACDIT